MSPALLFALYLSLPVGSEQLPSALEPSVVKLEKQGDIDLWTIRAKQSSVQALLARMSELSGREIASEPVLARAPLVTIALERRPLEQVLEFVLGSAGYLVDVNGASIQIRSDDASEETPDQRASLAAAAWARAAARHPRHPIAATARLALGELDELRGHASAARQRYLELLTQTPASPSASEAYLRAGRIAAEHGNWSEASEHFRALANLVGAEEYRAVARVELARATLGLGDAESALHILDALELTHPSRERSEFTLRSIVRVEALLAERRFQDALLEIETRSIDFDPLGADELPELRARALEGAGFHEEASRAWLLVARTGLGSARVSAYQSAARLAEKSGDPYAVLFAVREAKATGYGACVAAPEERALAFLGVAEHVEDPSPRAEQRLTQAEFWLEKHDMERATDELQLLFDERERVDLAPLSRARLVLGWARCLVPLQGIDAASNMARAERERLDPGDARAHLDRGMARLLEENGLFERAADAYGGDF